MYTKQDIKNDLRNLGIIASDTVLVHTSLKKIGKTESGADTVLDAFCETLNKGLLVLPGHTWSTVNADHPVFDAANSPVCVGTLPEVFRKRAGVYRSLHPTHSLLACGRGAEAFVSGEERFRTPCAPESCYGKLERLGGKVMLIGVDFMKCTLVHCIEEAAEVPGRLTETTEPLQIRTVDGTLLSVPSHRHQNSNSDYFEKLEPVLEYRGVLTHGKIGDADTIVCKIKDLFRITLELLEKNPRLFDDERPVPREWYSF